MIRKLPALMVFFVPALFFTTVIHSEEAAIANGALAQIRSNDKLLMTRRVTERQMEFERGMANAGWDIHHSSNLLFYNVRRIIARNDILSLQSEIDKEIALRYWGIRALDSSA